MKIHQRVGLAMFIMFVIFMTTPTPPPTINNYLFAVFALIGVIVFFVD